MNLRNREEKTKKSGGNLPKIRRERERERERERVRVCDLYALGCKISSEFQFRTIILKYLRGLGGISNLFCHVIDPCHLYFIDSHAFITCIAYEFSCVNLAIYMKAEK